MIINNEIRNIRKERELERPHRPSSVLKYKQESFSDENKQEEINLRKSDLKERETKKDEIISPDQNNSKPTCSFLHSHLPSSSLSFRLPNFQR